jgi:hypothetical protein
MDYLPELAHFGATGDLPETDYEDYSRRELYAEIESERGVVDHFYGSDAGAQQLADLDHLEIMLNRHYHQTGIRNGHIGHLINPSRTSLLTEPYQHLAPQFGGLQDRVDVSSMIRYAGIEEGEIDHPVGLIGGSIGAEHYGFRDMDASARIAGDYDLYDASGDDAYFADDESYFDDDENFTGGSPDMNLRGPDYSQPDPFGPAPAEGTAAEFTEYLAGVDRRQARRRAEREGAEREVDIYPVVARIADEERRFRREESALEELNATPGDAEAEWEGRDGRLDGLLDN